MLTDKFLLIGYLFRMLEETYPDKNSTRFSGIIIPILIFAVSIPIFKILFIK